MYPMAHGPLTKTQEHNKLRPVDEFTPSCNLSAFPQLAGVPRLAQAALVVQTFERK